MQKRTPMSNQAQAPMHNVEAEKAILGSMILDPGCIRDMDNISESDFFAIPHQKIFKTLKILFEKNILVDLIALNNELEKNGDLKTCGGAGYIASLTNSILTSANVSYYIDIVKSLSDRRRISRIARKLHEDSFRPDKEINKIIDGAQTDLYEIASGGSGDTITPLHDIVGPAVEYLEKLYKGIIWPGLLTGFPDIDNLIYGFNQDDFVVIGARPGVGKTALAICVAANNAIRKKNPIGFLSLEMSKERLVTRLLCSESRINIKTVKSGLLKENDFAKLVIASNEMYESPLYFEDSRHISSSSLRTFAMRMKDRYGIVAFFIDYLSLIPSDSKTLPRHEQVAEVSRILKGIARDLKIPVIALSQLVRDSDNRMPRLSDLRESGAIEQDADVIIFLHREKNEKNVTKINIAKNRDGPTGMVELWFLPEYTRFENYEKHRV
jgi:replicative DNA helicase